MYVNKYIPISSTDCDNLHFALAFDNRIIVSRDRAVTGSVRSDCLLRIVAYAFDIISIACESKLLYYCNVSFLYGGSEKIPRLTMLGKYDF